MSLKKIETKLKDLVAKATKSKEGKPKKAPRPKKIREFRINWLLVFALVCVAIPSGALAWVLLTAAGDSGTPQLGNRFEDAFAYEIQASDLKTVETELATIDGVEKVTISMPVATLRIYIDADDSFNAEKIRELAAIVYQKLDTLLPIDKYFTNTDDGVTQYDLEIYVYNNMSFEDDFIYFRLVKNAVSEQMYIQNVGKPLDPALAERLRNAEEVKDGQTGLDGDEDRSEDDE